MLLNTLYGGYVAPFATCMIIINLNNNIPKSKNSFVLAKAKQRRQAIFLDRSLAEKAVMKFQFGFWNLNIFFFFVFRSFLRQPISAICLLSWIYWPSSHSPSFSFISYLIILNRHTSTVNSFPARNPVSLSPSLPFSFHRLDCFECNARVTCVLYLKSSMPCSL